ncbi:MAG TPA: NUDIX hydrolase [Patescibacteria group bacterium]|nr:NUDIX hydrolase [Patescibacteria group bacterium]
MNVPTIAKAVLVNEHGEVLLLRRSQTDTRRPGQWDFPGGNVDADEDIRAAVIRETAEEAGIDLKHPVVVYGYSEPRLPWGFPTWIVFAEKVSGQPAVRLSEEHDQSTWMPLADAVEAFEYPLHRQTLSYLLDNKILDAL